MTRDTAPLPTTPASPSALAAGDASNGQHHLLRHVLSPEQCSDALHHFGTADSKAAARMVNRMSQRELRDMFAKVYNVHTNSNNNTWLRRKLLEAVGASRRFYAAANRTGRPKQRRAHVDSCHGGAAGATAKPRSPKAAHAPQHCVQRCSVQQLHHAVAPGPALPAGSPRALAARRRAAAAGSVAGLASAAHGAHPPPRHHFLLGSGSRFPPSQQSSEAGGARSEGSEGHPRALAPRAALDAGQPSGSSTPTSACAAAQPPSYHGLYASPQPAAMPCNRSRSSLQSSQHAANGLALVGAPAAVGPDGRLPHAGSFTTLVALLGGYPGGHPLAYAPGFGAAPVEPPPVPAVVPQQQLQQVFGSDLGVGLWVPTDANFCSLGPAPSLGKPGLDDDWLSWDDDWQLPALF